MADKRSEQVEEAHELDLDDTISAWDQVVEEAVAAVDKNGESPDGAPGTVEDPADGATSVFGASSSDAGTDESETGTGDSSASGEEESDRDDTEVRDLRDRLMRTLADFDNFRKRTEREKTSIQRFALFDVLKDFLDVFDNLERALAASGTSDDLKIGVEMIARQFSDLLRRHGVEVVEAVDRPFDPTVHEAVSRVEDADVEEPTVTAELQRGYRLHERLLRPAMVSVAMPVTRPEPDDEAAEAEASAEASVEETPSPDAPEPASAEAGPPEASQQEEREREETLGETVAQATETN